MQIANFRKFAFLFTFLGVCMTAEAKVVTKTITWKVGAQEFEGTLIYDDSSKNVRPGIVAVPNWMGVNAANLKQLEMMASTKYVILAADVYGKGRRPQNPKEAGEFVGPLKADRKVLRERVRAAHAALLENKNSVPVDVNRIGAIGFCFGGTAALELARSGTALLATTVFHAGLSSPTPADAKNIRGRVLALQGADDPSVSAEETRGFESEMREGKVDWQLVSFGGTVHSFTDLDAKRPGTAEYNEKSAKRAYQMMNNLFDEAFRN